MRRLFRGLALATLATTLTSNSDSLAIPAQRFRRVSEPFLEKQGVRDELIVTVDRQKFAWILPDISPAPYIIYNHGEEKNYVCGYVSKDKDWGAIALKNGSAVVYYFHNGTSEYDFKPVFYGLKNCTISESIPDNPNYYQRILTFIVYGGRKIRFLLENKTR